MIKCSLSSPEQASKEKNEHLQAFVPALGPIPTQSGWDGSYAAVDRYLKTIANDPSSIKIEGCTNVQYEPVGWAVRCNYRGKNAFGGVVVESNWFIIRNNQVLMMQPPEAYVFK